jgi:hypothetical protein
MNKNYLILGAIGLGFLFLLKPKFNPVFAETIPTPNIHEPIPLQTQPISTDTTTDFTTYGARTLMTILD